ncbi:MAG: glycosyltransferase, partial [Kiritimatiellia bacterium]
EDSTGSEAVMKVLHIVDSISRSSGGPARSVQGLVAGLNRIGIETWLMTFYPGDEPWVEGVEHFVNGGKFENVVCTVNPDLVHLHGIWSLGLHRCAAICRRRNIPYVTAPRGMLEPWSLKQKWLKKRIARWLYQDNDLDGAAALHATAESEAAQFKRLGLGNQIIVSPNGVNVPNDKSLLQLQLQTQTNTDGKRVLFVSRMHPKKGVLELVEAWKKVRLKEWKCELVYTVNGAFELAYEAKVKTRVNELGLQEQFIFTGALSDNAKWAAYARADVFVLPTYSENFGIVVAEALWAGLPVITTKGTPWQELETCKCGWWIDIGVEPLVEALKEAMSLSDEERAAMGARGRKLVEEKYTWPAVVKAMVNGYEEIVNART